MSKFNAEDFIQLTNSTDKQETITLSKKVFNAVDTDRSGFIDQKEMLEMMIIFGKYMNEKNGGGQAIGENLIKEMAQQGLNEMDVNHDGKVSYDEFLNYALTQNGLNWASKKSI